MSLRLYNRVYALTIGRVGFPFFFEGFNPLQGLRITFDVEKTIEAKPNKGSIRVYNLNPDHRDVVKPLDFLTLRAGYIQQVGVGTTGWMDLPIIFTGYISRTEVQKEDTEWVSTFSFGDGEIMKTKYVRTVLPKFHLPTLEVDSIVDEIQKMGIELAPLLKESIAHFIYRQFQGKTSDKTAGPVKDSFTNTVNSKMKVLSGNLEKLMTDATSKYGLKYSIQDNTLIVRPTGGSDSLPLIELNPQNGLLGSPQKLENGGLSGKCLIMPGFNPGRELATTSRTLGSTQTQVITRALFRGDTRGEEWFIEWESMVSGSKIELPATTG